MLKRTERVSPTHHGKLFSAEKETLEQLLIRVGAIKVKSYPVTPEHKPKTAPEQQEQPSSLKI